MNMRAFVGMLLAAWLVAIVGCGDSGTTGGGLPTTGAAPSPKVGLLVSGSTSDGGWNQLAKDSLDKFAAANHLDVAVREQVSKDAAADAIRQLDAKGFSLVIAHGFEYLDPVKELTDPARPGSVKVKVVVSGGDADNPHFQSLNYDLSGASYQLGIIAARVSKSGKLGFIGGEAVPTVTIMARGFAAGAKSVNPNVTVSAQYTGWDDPSKAKKQAEAYIDQGIDVIMQNVDAASRGVFEAVKEYNEKPLEGKRNAVYTFGANSDQNANPVCGDFTLASAVIRMDVAFERVLKQIKDGTFKGGMVKEDLAGGVCVAVVNPKLSGTVIDDQTLKLLDDAAQKLNAGQITIPAGDVP